MALLLGGTDISLKDTTVSVTVPNNNKARLMYYLDCMCNALELDSSDTQNIRKLRDYKNYYWLSQDETTQLFVLCAMISPDELLDKVIFHSNELCGDWNNKFYEVSQVRNMLVASRSIVIGGRTRRVNKIMTFKMTWIRTYYIDPMNALKNEIEAAREAERRRAAAARSQSDCIII